MAQPCKKTRGKQKIAIKRIEKEEDRMITFSKRKSGIYKKASELVTLTGAKVGVLIFSPTGKPYSFGHPSIESLSNRFMGVNLPPNDKTHPLIEAHRQVKVDELNHYLNNLMCQLAIEKERGSVLQDMKDRKETKGWWEAPIDELSVEDLSQLDKAFEELTKVLHRKLNERKLGTEGASSSSLLQ